MPVVPDDLPVGRELHAPRRSRACLYRGALSPPLARAAVAIAAGAGAALSATVPVRAGAGAVRAARDAIVRAGNGVEADRGDAPPDRNSVVWGKSVSVRGDLGGRL